MMVELWNWLVVPDEQITCSSALFSASFTLNILLSAIPSVKRNLFNLVRDRVHRSVDDALNASILANMDNDSRFLVFLGKRLKRLVAPFYDKKETCVKWPEVIFLVVMVGFATASVVLMAMEHKSRLGLLFCLSFPIYFLLCFFALVLRFGLIKLLSSVTRWCCARKGKQKKEKAIEIFSEIASMAGITTSSLQGTTGAAMSGGDAPPQSAKS